MQNIDFPSDFLEATQSDWEASALRALKGAALDALNTPIAGGLENKPLYQGRTDSAPLQLRESSRPWKIIQRSDHPVISEANARCWKTWKVGLTASSWFCLLLRVFLAVD
ncbi:hypothetical protein [Pseudovibrio denitrificans]|uniref:hypothetical protein n=1 Tax=Pseudovibrio denitrificans TaxID=258256 RepID=UPI001AD902F4|nr:hypothetical protein [Pseudovibrio denitrificans]